MPSEVSADRVSYALQFADRLESSAKQTTDEGRRAELIAGAGGIRHALRLLGLTLAPATGSKETANSGSLRSEQTPSLGTLGRIVGVSLLEQPARSHTGPAAISAEWWSSGAVINLTASGLTYQQVEAMTTQDWRVTDDAGDDDEEYSSSSKLWPAVGGFRGYTLVFAKPRPGASHLIIQTPVDRVLEIPIMRPRS